MVMAASVESSSAGLNTVEPDVTSRSPSSATSAIPTSVKPARSMAGGSRGSSFGPSCAAATGSVLCEWSAGGGIERRTAGGGGGTKPENDATNS